MAKFCCQVCSTFFASTIVLMIKHLVKLHRNDPNVRIVCETPGCQPTFKNVSCDTLNLSSRRAQYDFSRPDHNVRVQHQF